MDEAYFEKELYVPNDNEILAATNLTLEVEEYFDLPDKRGIEFRLRVSACVLTFLAIVLWVVTWVRGRQGSPYRYALLLLFFFTILLDQALALAQQEELNNLNNAMDESTFIFYSIFLSLCDDINLCCLLGYMALCLVCLMKRAATPAEVTACLFLCVVPTVCYEVVVHLLEYKTEIVQEVGGYPAFFGLVRDPPFTLGLLLAILATFAIAVKSFLPGGPMSRDHRYIRVSGVGMIVVVLYRCVVHVLLNVFLFDSDRTGGISHWINIPLALRGIVESICLCYIDLEVWSMFPCITIKDQHRTEYIIGREAEDGKTLLTGEQMPFYGTGTDPTLVGIKKDPAAPSQDTAFLERESQETFSEKQ